MSGENIIAVFTVIVAIIATFLIIKKKKLRDK